VAFFVFSGITIPGLLIFNIASQGKEAHAAMATKEERNLTLPGNLRYQPKALRDVFGYDNLFGAVGEVEIAVLQTLAEIGLIPQDDIELLTPDVVNRILAIRTTDVDEIERAVTKHDIRAWVRAAQEIFPEPLRRWVHVPLTSYDALDTARALQFTRAYKAALKPAVKEVSTILAGLVKKFADQIQIGRTHGQHAIPITVGFWFATILDRILYNARMMEMHASELCGKISGAVGAHNAQIGLGIAERCGEFTFEHRVLQALGLNPARISTQILPPEPLEYFLHACAALSAALGQFGRDCRNLMRSEIGELSEAFEEGQVGSSTMAHKRNPVNFENLEGMWVRTKHEFMKVLDTLISEHQRDLVGSSVARDFPIILVNLMQQLGTLLRKDKNGAPFLSGISIDAEACRRNFEASAHLILAEPIYLALQMAGYADDAHELVNRRAVPIAQKERKPLITVVETLAEENENLRAALGRIPQDALRLFHSPETYIGDAREQALKVAAASTSYWNVE
jgi:adenylosuccinate lyase